MSIEGKQKGYLFCQKWDIKGYGVGSRDRASPYKMLLNSPLLPPPPPPCPRGLNALLISGIEELKGSIDNLSQSCKDKLYYY